MIILNIYNCNTINCTKNKKGGDSMTKTERTEFLQELKVMMEETVDKVIEPLKEDIKELKCKVEVIPNMQEDIRNISRSVAVIEVEHGKKLDILFEALGINSDNIEANKKRIKKCERKIERNEAEIYYLKTHLSKV